MATVRLKLCDHDTEKLDRIAVWLGKSKVETLRLLVRTFPLMALVEDEFVARGLSREQSMSGLTRIIKCPQCRRRRECTYLEPAQFGSKRQGSRWQCQGCAHRFSLSPAVSSSLLNGEYDDA